MKSGLKTIAYFCAEYGIEEDIPLYAGGLGILAGDIVREAGRRKDIRFVAIGLFNRRGIKTAGNTSSMDYSEALVKVGFEKVKIGSVPVTVDIPTSLVSTKGGIIMVGAWQKSYGTATLYLLDANSEITDYLYDSSEPNRIYQELILGVGGVKMLNKLGISPDKYHLNEGHAGFGTLAAVLENGGKGDFSKRLEKMRSRLVATKHTILSAAGTDVSRVEFDTYIAPYINSMNCKPDEVYAVGSFGPSNEKFSSTRFLMKTAGKTSGVSVAHTIAEKKKHPESMLIPITNGVDPSRWQSEKISDESLAEAKQKLRSELVEYANKISSSKLADDRLTIVWARRFASYKRPGFFFNNEKELLALVTDEKMPIQIVVAGKAHPLDAEGVRALETVKKLASDARFAGKIAYIPNYSIAVSKILVKGADVWLNTPIPGFEACGTSGMKAGLNGAIEMSTDDGWVSEVPELKKVGCIIPEENIEKNIYKLMRENIVVPFYSEKSRKSGASPGTSVEWLARVRQTIDIVASRFSISRMLDEYVEKLYNH